MAVTESASVADLISGTTIAAQLAHLRAQGLLDETGLGWVLDRAEELVHGEPAVAERLAGLCSAAAEAAGLAGPAARSSYLQARICAERGDLVEGLRLIAAARQHWLQDGQRLQAMRTDLGRMQVLDDLGRHAEAVAVGDALLA